MQAKGDRVLTTFATRDEFAAALSAQLAEELAPGESAEQIRSAILSGILSSDDELQREFDADPRGALELRVGRWFLRTDDAPYFETAGLIGTIVTTLIASGGMPFGVVLGVATSVAGAAWRVYRKGGKLTADQLAVMVVLQGSGPQPLDEIVGALANRPPTNGDGSEMDHRTVRLVLASLKDVELRDGSSAALVRRSDDQTWRVVGV